MRSVEEVEKELDSVLARMKCLDGNDLIEENRRQYIKLGERYVKLRDELDECIRAEEDEMEQSEKQAKLEKLNSIFERLGLCRVEDSINSYGIDVTTSIEMEELDFLSGYLEHRDEFERAKALEKIVKKYHKYILKAEEKKCVTK